jgi:replicative DNA helicase
VSFITFSKKVNLLRGEKMKNTLQNSAIERAVLAGLCQYGLDVFLDLDFLESDYFTHEVNQILFSCIKEIVQQNQNIEYLTIFSTAEKLGVFELINNKEEMAFIRSLFNFPIDKDNLPLHAATLAKLKLARDIKLTLKICDGKIEKVKGDEDISEIISIVETPILELTSEAYQTSNLKTKIIGSDVENYIDYLINNQVDMIGIPTGFKAYDAAIGGGLRRICVDFIAARPKTGKSVFASNVSNYVAGKHNIPVLYLDTEMSIEDQLNRVLASISGVEINKIATGKFGNNFASKEKVEKAAQYLKNIPYHYISIAGQPFENILNIMKRWIYQHVGFDETGRTKDCLIIYDYLKLMSSSGINASMQEYQVLGFQITQLHNFCVKYDVPCLSFVQLNRENEVAQSDRLIWLCTSFTKFEKKSDEEIADDGDQNGNRKLDVQMSRHGSGLGDGDYVNLIMNGAISKVTEGLTRNELKSGKTLSNESESFDIQETNDESDLFDL